MLLFYSSSSVCYWAPATGSVRIVAIHRLHARRPPLACCSPSAARGGDFAAVCTAADQLRRRVHGERVTYVVNRNINYTNVCTYKCQFCAFR